MGAIGILVEIRHPNFAGPTSNTSAYSSSSSAHRIKQAMDISVGLNQSTVQFRAVLLMKGGSYLQQRLSVPQQLTVRDLQVTQGGINRLKRWADDGQGTLTLYFSSPLTGEHGLSLTGEIPTPSALPLLFVQDAKIPDYQVKIFRRPAVSVSVAGENLGGLLSEIKAGQYDPVLGRFVAAIQCAGTSDATASIKLRVTPNRPNVRGQLVTRLEFNENGWTAEAQLALRVARGELDSFSIVDPRTAFGAVSAGARLAVRSHTKPGTTASCDRGAPAPGSARVVSIPIALFMEERGQ